MIQIVKPRHYDVYKPKVEALLDLFTVYQKLEFSSEAKNKTTFMMAEDRKLGVYGGALLYQQPLSQLDGTIRKIISTLHSPKRKIWTVNLFFPGDEGGAYSSLEGVKFCQDFYNGLLKQLIKFAQQKKVPFLVLTLPPSEVFKTKTYGRWPYLLEVYPKDARDGLFHGILSLKLAKGAVFKDTWLTQKYLRTLRGRGL